MKSDVAYNRSRIDGLEKTVGKITETLDRMRPRSSPSSRLHRSPHLMGLQEAVDNLDVSLRLAYDDLTRCHQELYDLRLRVAKAEQFAQRKAAGKIISFVDCVFANVDPEEAIALFKLPQQHEGKYTGLFYTRADVEEVVPQLQTA